MLPTALLEQLPFPLQQQVAHTLDQVEQAMAGGWPVFKVTPSRWVRIRDLNEDELREVGLLTELDGEGQLIYRDRISLQQLTPADIERLVLVSLRTSMNAVPPRASAT